MGVDYYSCSCCGDALYEEFTDDCANCGVRLCVDCLTTNTESKRDGRYTYPYTLISEIDDMSDEERIEFLKPLYDKYTKEEVDRCVS